MRKLMIGVLAAVAWGLLFGPTGAPAGAPKAKRIVLLGMDRDHGPGDHEYMAGLAIGSAILSGKAIDVSYGGCRICIPVENLTQTITEGAPAVVDVALRSGQGAQSFPVVVCNMLTRGDVMEIGIAAVRDSGLEVGILRAERPLHRPRHVTKRW